jgi:hypothetical protein
MAKWYEKNPTKVFLPKELEYLRNRELISVKELGKAVGVAYGNQWARRMGLEPVLIKDQGVKQYRFADFERAVLSDLPNGFYDPDNPDKPVAYMHARTKLKYSEALCVVPVNFFRGGLNNRVMFAPISFEQVNSQLGAPSTEEESRETVFARFNRLEPDGTVCVLRTHMLRRWLSSLVKHCGLSDALIAKWAGRDIDQNDAYNYPDKERDRKEMREAGMDRMTPSTDGQPGDAGRLAVARFDQVLGNEMNLAVNVMTPEQYANMRVPSMHETPYGRCIRDYLMDPCEAPWECMNCSSQVCKKECARIGPLKIELQQEEANLAQMEAERAEAAAEGDAAADYVSQIDNWLEFQQVHIAKLRELLSIMEDPLVKEGQWFLPNTQGGPSLLTLSVQERAALEAPDSDEALLAALLTSDVDHRKLLGMV